MKKSILLLTLFCNIAIVQAQETKKVLFIGIDGVRPDALTLANTPNLDDLIANGFYSNATLNDDITISGPGWAANLCGIWSDKHLVTGNDFTINDFATYPTIFKYIEDYDSELSTASFVHWNPINDHIVLDDVDFKLNVDTDQELSDVASSYLLANNPDIMFLHYDDVDHAGHNYGFSPSVPEYIATIETTDVLIGEVLDALAQRPNYEMEDWLVLVTTDHGGQGFSHGGNSIEEQEVFTIASGKYIPTTMVTKDSSLVAVAGNCLNNTSSLTFDGDGDYLQVPTLPIYDFGANQDFTVECRIRTSQAADVAILGNKDWDSGVNPGFVFSFKFASGPEWKVNIGDGTNRVDVETGSAIADNGWHTLSASFDRDGMLRMYEDGVLVGEEDISSIGDISTNAGIFAGADIFGAYAFTGAIEEIRIWNTVVDAAAIEAWHCTVLTDSHPNDSDLLGYWKVDEGTGMVVTDYSAFGNQADIVNATWVDMDAVYEYDYTNTPRIVDVPVTALTHLCVPIDEAWGLEGTSLIAECMPDAVGDVAELSWSIYPNPTNDGVTIDLASSAQAELAIYNINGQLILNQAVANGDWVALNDVSSGVYFYTIRIENQMKRGKLILVE